MRIYEIFNLIKQYFYLGLFGVIALGILGAVGYFVIYRKLFGGKRTFTRRGILLSCAFIGYLIMVMGVTLFDRGEYFKGSVNLHFLSSYRDAWHSFTLRGWQQLIFNIIMFVPFGILLPLIHKRFHRMKWTMGTALGFTLFIETIQLVTGFGVFELDDMFNNVLGAFIGYGIIMAILTLLRISKHKFIKTLAYLSPLLLIIAVFTGIFTYYHSKEFGNVNIAYRYKMNMTNVEVAFHEELNHEQPKVPIYKAQGYTKEKGKEFAIDFFQNLGINTGDIEINQYNDNAIYWVHGHPSYNIWINYRDGSYTYHDSSAFDDGMETVSADKEQILEALEGFNIHVPAKAAIQSIENNGYQWMMERDIAGDILREGSISCYYYRDGTIKDINHQLVTYNRAKDVSIKSEKEAYEELLEGKFSYFHSGEEIGLIDIKEVELDYYLDSKGYYQPVYSFDGLIDGEEYSIIIPALL